MDQSEDVIESIYEKLQEIMEVQKGEEDEVKEFIEAYLKDDLFPIYVGKFSFNYKTFSEYFSGFFIRKRSGTSKIELFEIDYGGFTPVFTFVNKANETSYCNGLVFDDTVEQPLRFVLINKSTALLDDKGNRLTSIFIYLVAHEKLVAQAVISDGTEMLERMKKYAIDLIKKTGKIEKHYI